jgi:hypothetical protein
MKTLLLLSVLLVSCGKEIVVERIQDPPVIVDTSLQCDVFDIQGVPGIPNFKKLNSLGTISVSRIDSVSSAANVAFKPFENTEYVNLTENFGMSCSGLFEALESGNYTFVINSDDGSTLTLGETKLIDNNGDHGMVRKTITIFLVKGTYKFNTTYYNHIGSKGFVLSYRRPASSFEEVMKF